MPTLNNVTINLRSAPLLKPKINLVLSIICADLTFFCIDLRKYITKYFKTDVVRSTTATAENYVKIFTKLLCPVSFIVISFECAKTWIKQSEKERVLQCNTRRIFLPLSKASLSSFPFQRRKKALNRTMRTFSP